jgi:hypothetical protein
MRGLREKRIQTVQCSGITPAHAGTTNSIVQHRRPVWDHPRACGVYEIKFFSRFHVLGSPPRMRGLREKRIQTVQCSGITPAHAGTTNIRVLDSVMAKDHPRACGDYFYTGKTIRRDVGSPPRMRGLPALF